MSAPKERKEKKEKEKTQHRECHFVLTMTTEEELNDAISKELKILKNEETDEFLYAKDGASPLTFDLKLNFKLPLTTQAYFDQVLCSTSKISLSNWSIKEQKNFVHKNVVCLDIYSIPADNRVMHQFSPKFSVSDNSEVSEDYCREGGFRKLYLPKDESESNSTGYVIAENHKFDRALFKVERRSNKNAECSCEPCKARVKPRFVAFADHNNIVKLERL